MAVLRSGGPAGPAGSTSALYLLGVLAAARAAGLVLLAQALAVGIASMAAGSLDAHAVLLQGVTGTVLRTVAAWGQDATAARLALGVKERLRENALTRVLDAGGTARISPIGTGQGSLAVLLTRGLDGLDKYYTLYLPALVTCAVVPLLIGVRILAADWISALVVVLTVPLVPVFMALIGLHTRERTQEAAAALGRLSDHLSELARGLPVLVGLGRAAEQTRALRDIAGTYTSRTMTTLRTVFLSSLALELISTISVAVVAVFAGVRLIHGDLGLETALIALILAPECYGPLREVGAAHHASEDGEEAGARIRDLVDAPVDSRGESPDDPGAPVPSGEGIRVHRLTARYDGALRPVFEDVSFLLAPGTITALRGASGTGKSTLMRVLARGAAVPEGLHHTGTITGSADVAWVPQHPELLLDTVRAELALYAGLPEDSAAIPAQLTAVDAADLVDRRTGELSPGELRRVAVARALLRAENPAVHLLLLDEPTAHVDSAASAAIRAAIRRRRPGLGVLLIAHDDATAALADTQVQLGDQGTSPRPTAIPGRTSGADRGSPGTGADPALSVLGGSIEPSTDGPATRTPVGPGAPGATRGRRRREPSGLTRARDVLTLVRPWDRRFLAAALLALGASLFAVALTALSGWLIVRAAQQPPILYLLTAFVGVRFFGIGRSLLRYVERLELHRAVFHRADETRLRLWTGLLSSGVAWRTLAHGSGGVERLVGDVDELRDLSSRALLPFTTAVLTGVAALATTSAVHPSALGWQALVVTGSVVVAPCVAVLRERAAGAAAVHARAAALERVTGLLRAAPDLQVNGVSRAALGTTRRLDARMARSARRTAVAAGSSTAVVVAFCCSGALGILLTATALPAELLAVLVLMQLALIEPFVAGTGAVQHWGPLAAVTARIRPWLGPDPEGDPHAAGDAGADAGGAQEQSSAPVRSVVLEGAAIGYEPGHPVVRGMHLRLDPGRWTALVGPSGSGKSTVLGALLGFLPLEDGRLLVDGRAPAAGRSTRIAWCPQESHLFASSLRANLQLARRPGDAATEEELRAAIHAVGLDPLVGSLEDGLDASVGPGGSRLSGGQRQRLAVARALLTRSGVLLLDEPTAHLDADGARSLLQDLRRGLGDTAVLLVTHDADEAASCDAVVSVEGAPSADLRWQHEHA